MDQRTVEIVMKVKDEASRSLGNINSATKQVESDGMSKLKAGTVALGTAMGNLAVQAGEKLVEALGDSFTAFRESKLQSAELEQVLKATGRTSEFTLQQLEEMAGGLEKVSLFEDEAIMNTQSLMLGFSNIGKDVLPMATQSAMDMAQAMGTDLQGATIQLAKALNDPAEGVSALTRVGVTFTEEEKKMMEQMGATGDIAGAQQKILETLAGPNGFGGAAKAASDASGGMETLKDTMNNVKESVGGFLDGALTQAISGMQGFWKAFNGEDNDSSGFVGFMENLGTKAQELYEDLLPIAKVVWDYLKPAFEELWTTISTELWPAIKQLWEELNPELMQALKIVAMIIGAVVVASIKQFLVVLNIIIKVISWVISAYTQWVEWNRAVAQAIGEFVGKAIVWFSNLKQNIIQFIAGVVMWFRSLPDKIMDAVSSLWGRVTSFFGSIGEGIKNAISGAIDSVKSTFKSGINWIIDKINVAVRGINGMTGKVGLPSIPEIPKLASGTHFSQGGLTLVGEKGPELVTMPRGARVDNAERTSDMMQGSGKEISIVQNIYNQLDMDLAIRNIGWKLSTV